jgi:hypothetical protein
MKRAGFSNFAASWVWLAAAGLASIAPDMAFAGDPNAILAAAPADVRQAFKVKEDTLVHQPTGVRCPMTFEGSDLVKVDKGGPGDNGRAQVQCVYALGGSTLAILTVAPSQAPSALSDPFCKGLPEVLKVGKGLPGAAKYEAPSKLDAGGATSLTIEQCSWYRPPMSIIDHVAATVKNGWAVTVIHTPPPPARGQATINPMFLAWPAALLQAALPVTGRLEAQ